MRNNTGNYSGSIEFETEVYPGVFWVPVNTLGKSRYTNEQMAEISKMPVENRRNLICNLYEAVQLFQISDFKGVFDNVNYWINDVQWQIHKSPEDAVLTNEGCCATDTNWLAYFIKDKYDSVGSFCYANADGNGHITTYIRCGNYYYFLDMMMCRNDSQKYLCNESGVLSELLNSEWAGFLYRCKNPVDFSLYCISRFKAQNRSVPFCFYMRESDCVTATGLYKTESEVNFYIPKHENPIIIYRDNDQTRNVLIVDFPEQLKEYIHK